MTFGIPRLSSAIKIFLILGLALFPLGLVAVLASLDAARDGRSERETVARIRATQSATALQTLVDRNLLVLRVASAGLSRLDKSGQACAAIVRAARADRGLRLGDYVLTSPGGTHVCSSPNYVPTASDRPSAGNPAPIWLDVNMRSLRYQAVGEAGTITAGIARNDLLGALPAPDQASPYSLTLQQGEARLALVEGSRRSHERMIVTRARLATSNVFAVASVGATPVSAVETVTIILPIVMWFAAALLGWVIVDRLLLRPIVAMQRAVAAYRPGGQAVVVPPALTPATEIRELGEAFARVTGTVAAHEAELEAAIARQARLVREIHHRVKNNLQVVASLLNLHARGAKSADAADAYASIQRRVDALAVVHRNHFAELEDDRGVALRTLLSELAGNLRGTAPDAAAGMSITLDLDTIHANQDVAVSVAFFVTEVVEHAMLCTPHAPVGVSLRQTHIAGIARLTLTSASLKAGTDCAAVDVRQFDRITTGLSRQLRAVLERDTDTGTFGIDIAVQPPAGS